MQQFPARGMIINMATEQSRLKATNLAFFNINFEKHSIWVFSSKALINRSNSLARTTPVERSKIN
jgi:hypothetical protein